MTAVKVVDASALAALLFNEPESGAVLERLTGARLVASPLLAFELVNTCLKKCRQCPDRTPQLAADLALLKSLSIEERQVDHDAVLLLALDTKLTAYDASYLWLAMELDAELVTLDGALERAWASRSKVS